MLRFARLALQRARDADVVDAHFALYAALPVALGIARRRPLVVHFQGPWADENWIQGDHSTIRRWLRRRLERFVYRRAHQVVVLSNAFAEVAVERYGVSPGRIRQVSPGVDIGRFDQGDRTASRQSWGVDPGAFVAVCVRRLVPRMGIEDLLEAWDQVVAELPPHSKLFIAGEGDLFTRLRLRIEQSRVPDSVALLGRLSDEELVRIYQAADVGVVPTREHEGFGLVVVEAAACGTPSIVTDVDGLPESVQELDASLVVPHSQPLLLAARLHRAAHGDLPGREAARRFAEKFEWGNVVARHRDIYERVIRDRVA
jgi:glycosyltransferase involved in cell wall biosynthesis